MVSVNLIVAMARGAWNRIRSAVLGGTTSASRIIQIVDSPPTSVLLTSAEARKSIDWVKDASRAANDWWNGGNEKSIRIPVIPHPELPALDGGEPGKYNVSLIVKDPEGKLPPTPLGFSANKLPSVAELVERIDEFVESESGRGTPKFQRYLRDLADKLLYDPRNAFVPLDIMERMK